MRLTWILEQVPLVPAHLSLDTVAGLPTMAHFGHIKIQCARMVRQTPSFLAIRN